MHWLLDRDLMIVLLISIVAAATGFAALTAVLLHHLLYGSRAVGTISTRPSTGATIAKLRRMLLWPACASFS